MVHSPKDQGDDSIATSEFFARFLEAARNGSIPPQVIKKICGGDDTRLRPGLEAFSKAAAYEDEYEVDLAADPFVPDPVWGNEKERGKYAVSVTYHESVRPRKFVADELGIALLNEPGDISPVYGSELHRRAFAGNRRPWNANMLDFLLEHPIFIPDELKGRTLCFNNTVYRDLLGSFVRTLTWCGFRWIWGVMRIEKTNWKHLWHGQCHAAIQLIDSN